MFKFGISYYTMEDGVRLPQSGVDIRLLRPGEGWNDGKKLREQGPQSGYYEIAVENEADCGYYEIWDDLNAAQGRFSGKSCSIGKLDARGLQNNCIYSNHVQDGAITAGKVANNSIGANHLQEAQLPLSKLVYELQNEKDGIGDRSQGSPASCRDDTSIKHRLKQKYGQEPLVILINRCNCHIYLGDIRMEGDQVNVTLMIGNNFDAQLADYLLLVLPL